jgi:pilus assembly protein Flp/PilA
MTMFARITKKTASAVPTMLQLVQDEAGQDLIEYALVACLVALAAVASMKNVGTKLVASFTGISSGVTNSI